MLGLPCFSSDTASVSIEPARRAEIPSAASTAIVAINVLIGWCQNSQTIVSADKANIAKKATMFLRAFGERVMPAFPLGVPNS